MANLRLQYSSAKIMPIDQLEDLFDEPMTAPVNMFAGHKDPVQAMSRMFRFDVENGILLRQDYLYDSTAILKIRSELKREIDQGNKIHPYMLFRTVNRKSISTSFDEAVTVFIKPEFIEPPQYEIIYHLHYGRSPASQ
jgi:hypothetical protein